MKKFLSRCSLAVFSFTLTCMVFAQNATAPASSQQAAYFSLEYHSPDQMDQMDTAILQKHNRDVLAEAEFYGYDMASQGWKNEQITCPMIPDYLLVRYSNKTAAGAESLFTVLVPRGGGRVWIVPVLNHGATRFKPAPVDPRNFQIFSNVVPADMAKENSGPEGKWLTLSACYAEMTDSRVQVLKEPSSDVHTIRAPSPTLRIAVTGKEHEVFFAQPVSDTDYRLWSILYNEAGHIISVSNDQHPFGEIIVQHPMEPTAKQTPQPSAPAPH